ncbi:MAG TPA: efflux RND transporter periplasmic adaptor subunit, partial [Pseudomonas sp.]|nr:efflux RND transporter periplasmic adaptor subunit [Pseudomonas sp.]
MAAPGLKTVVGLSFLVLLTACGDKPQVEKDRPRVFVQEVKSADYAASVTLTGDVQARVQTELSFRVGGKIIQR